MNDTRAVVKAYFDAWTSKNTEAAYALLAPDLEFRGPSAHYMTAEQFRPGLVGFAAITKAARIVSLLIDGDQAAMLYDCELVPPASAPIRIASLFRVEGGKIRWYETCFDPTEFRKVMAARQG